MLNELIVSLYIFGLLAAGIVLLKLVLDRVVERFTAHPLPLHLELGYELAKWIPVVAGISLAYLEVLRLFLFLSVV